jgi:hypothetical protein
MQREWNYEVSRERLAGVGRETSRKLYGGIWGNRRLYWGVFLLAGAVAAYNSVELGAWLAKTGIPVSQNHILGLVLLFIVVALWELRRLRVAHARGQADSGPAVHLIKDDGGLRFASKAMECYLKWEGIDRIVLERDGVVISCAGMAWFVADAAFRDVAERRVFIQEVYGRLGERARVLSERCVQSALAS